MISGNKRISVSMFQFLLKEIDI